MTIIKGLTGKIKQFTARKRNWFQRFQKWKCSISNVIKFTAIFKFHIFKISISIFSTIQGEFWMIWLFCWSVPKPIRTSGLLDGKSTDQLSGHKNHKNCTYLQDFWWDYYSSQWFSNSRISIILLGKFWMHLNLSWLIQLPNRKILQCRLTLNDY